MAAPSLRAAPAGRASLSPSPKVTSSTSRIRATAWSGPRSCVRVADRTRVMCSTTVHRQPENVIASTLSAWPSRLRASRCPTSSAVALPKANAPAELASAASGEAVVDADADPFADHRLAVLARRSHSELPCGLADRACEVRTERLGELDTVVHAISGDRLAGDDAVAVLRIMRQVPAQLGISRLARPFRGIESFAVRTSSDRLAVARAPRCCSWQ